MVRELVNVYKVNLFQKDKVHLTLSHAVVTIQICALVTVQSLVQQYKRLRD